MSRENNTSDDEYTLNFPSPLRRGFSFAKRAGGKKLFAGSDSEEEDFDLDVDFSRVRLGGSDKKGRGKRASSDLECTSPVRNPMRSRLSYSDDLGEEKAEDIFARMAQQPCFDSPVKKEGDIEDIRYYRSGGKCSSGILNKSQSYLEKITARALPDNLMKSRFHGAYEEINESFIEESLSGNLILSDNHGTHIIPKLLIRNMPLLKKKGIGILFLEMLNSNMQDEIDKYLSSDTALDEGVVEYLNRETKGHSDESDFTFEDEYSWVKVLESAKQYDIKVYAIDNECLRKGLKGENRTKGFNYFAYEIINEIKAKIYSGELPKFIIYTGESHVNYFREVLGLADLLDGINDYSIRDINFKAKEGEALEIIVSAGDKIELINKEKYYTSCHIRVHPDYEIDFSPHLESHAAAGGFAARVSDSSSISGGREI